MRTILGLVSVLVVAVAFSIILAGELPTAPAADEAAIQKLVADLGHKDAALRDAAQKRLVEIGIPAHAALATAAKSDDPEVRARAGSALKTIRENTAAKAVRDCPEVTVKDFGKAAAAASGPIISPNGEGVAFIVRDPIKGTTSLVFNGKEGPAWDSLIETSQSLNPRGFNFSQDGKSMLYSARRGGESYIVVAGEDGKSQECPAKADSVYSPDGRLCAFVRTPR